MPVPEAVLAPLTVNRTDAPTTGPFRSLTFAVTVCGDPTSFVASAGVSVTSLRPPPKMHEPSGISHAFRMLSYASFDHIAPNPGKSMLSHSMSSSRRGNVAKNAGAEEKSFGLV